ncbi:hypothetical protein [Dyadobacter bucti]|uniref:hypothetical protein n=1 Tax=Dyadobacter bucti TaxID=2572203 RepID=UPI001107EC46|nr:hypothetical protein [Dyadobacter bucti]
MLTKLIFFGCLLLLFLRVTPTKAQEAPLDFYNSLINSVQSAEGRMILSLNRGFFKANIGGKTFLINVDETTPFEPKMSVVFKYDGGTLTSATLTFIPKIHIALLGVSCASVGIDTLTYDSDGDVNGGNPTFDTQGCSQASAFEINRFLEMKPTPNDLLSGTPFLNTKAMKSVDKNGNIKPIQKPFISRVRFLRSENQEKALAVTLKPNSTLFFSKTNPGSPGSSNSVTTESEGHVLFQSLDFDIETRQISGQLNELGLSLDNGTIGNNDAVFKFEKSTSVVLQNVSFSKNNLGSFVDATSGIIKGQLGFGSFLTVFDTPRVNKFLLDDGTSIDLVGFEIRTDNRVTKISFDIGSRLKLNIREAILSLGFGSFVALGSSNLDANISCIYESNKRPKIAGSFNQFDALITHGLLKINSNTELNIAQGNISSNSLAINSAQSPIFVGSFRNFSVILNEDSKFGIPGGFEVFTSSNGTIEASDPTFPMQLSLGQEFVTGRFRLKIPIKSFFNGSNKKFAVNGGILAGTIERNEEGEIKCNNFNITGSKIQLALSLPQLKKEINIPVDLTEGFATAKPGTTPNFTAKIALRVPNTLNLLTLEVGNKFDEKEHRVFYHKSTISLGIKDEIGIGPAEIKFTGNQIDFNTSFIASLIIDVPGGCGEKDFDDDKSGPCNGDGPDRIKSFQEIINFDCPAAGTMHIYAKPDRYFLSMGFDVGFNSDNEFVAQIKTFKSPTSFGVDRDGCDDTLSGLVGGLLHVITGIPLPVTVIFAGSVIDNEIDSFLQTQAFNFVNDFSKSVKLRL